MGTSINRFMKGISDDDHFMVVLSKISWNLRAVLGTIIIEKTLVVIQNQLELFDLSASIPVCKERGKKRQDPKRSVTPEPVPNILIWPSLICSGPPLQPNFCFHVS